MLGLASPPPRAKSAEPPPHEKEVPKAREEILDDSGAIDNAFPHAKEGAEAREEGHMVKPQLIINADGYGLTAGTNRAIEECIRFGTVRSVSVNVNFPEAEETSPLIRRYPWLSVGCHLNPVVGRPVLPEDRVRSLLGPDGEFWYRQFDRKFILGHIDLGELRAELFAQVERCRELSGENFTHVDCHMAKHRLPRFYPLFLDASRFSRVHRVRTHKYLVVSGERGRLGSAVRYYLRHPYRLGVQAWNMWLREKARHAGLSMPDRRVAVAPSRGCVSISLAAWTNLLRRLPSGLSEFVVHPGYGDAHLRRVSGYVGERDSEREILLSVAFKNILDSTVRLSSYHDIPLKEQGGKPWLQ